MGTKEEGLGDLLQDVRRIHMIGIGGSGMNALAKVLAEAGYQVSGSDLSLSKTTEALASIGIEIKQGHAADNVAGADLVVISSAIPADNPELSKARSLGLQVVKRAELLSELTRRQRSILVAGTHGKTTTSSMTALLLERAGLDPTIIVGGDVIDLGTSAKLGKGNYLVAEADEFDRTFLKLSPWTAVITNVEADHLDYYGSLDAIVEAFDKFIGMVPEDGHLVACWDEPPLRKLARRRGRGVVSYGIKSQADWRAVRIKPNALGGNDFEVRRRAERVGRFSLQVPGRHNVLNALASIAAASLVGVDLDEARETLAGFRGAARRFELKGAANGIVVYDDYAHHPTEIAATLKGARERHPGRIWAVFQPHTYNRTKHHLLGFARALELADQVVVTDIYMPAGREVDTVGISASDIVRAMNHAAARHIPRLDEVVAHVVPRLQPGDMLLTMGAGDVNKVAVAVLKRLGEKG